MKPGPSLLTLLECPYCSAGRGILAIDPGRLRAIDGWSREAAPKVTLPRAARAGLIVFDPDGRGHRPCQHLVLLSGHFGWVSAATESGMLSMGKLRVGWSDPDVRRTIGTKWSDMECALARVRELGQPSQNQPTTRFQLIECSSKVEVACSGGPWYCHLMADGFFSPEPMDLAAILSGKAERGRVGPD